MLSCKFSLRYDVLNPKLLFLLKNKLLWHWRFYKNLNFENRKNFQGTRSVSYEEYGLTFMLCHVGNP